LFELYYQSILSTMFFTLSGLYFLVEGVILNIIFLCAQVMTLGLVNTTVTIPLMLNTLVHSTFNVIDVQQHTDKEYSSFQDLINIDKQTTHLAEFVDRLLPKHIQRIIKQGRGCSDSYKDVTLLYADICGFTEYSAGKSPRQVIEMLSRLFTDFDKECNRLNLFKLYTIGDCYVVMSMTDKKDRKTIQEEANDVLQLAISMLKIIAKVRKQISFDKLNMRIGVHTGDVYGGIIGTEIVRFDLYGQNVVIANKMESGGKAGRINVSNRTKQILQELETSNYVFEDNEEIYVKSLGISVNSSFIVLPSETGL
jgi:class 3 adenylate cyclase